jgi:hypothetical protein
MTVAAAVFPNRKFKRSLLSIFGGGDAVAGDSDLPPRFVSCIQKQTNSMGVDIPSSIQFILYHFFTALTG